MAETIPPPGPGETVQRRSWLVTARRGDVVRSAIAVALVVGSILNVINQGDRILGGSGISLPHVFLNYAVPYAVATWSATRAVIRGNAVAIQHAPRTSRSSTGQERSG